MLKTWHKDCQSPCRRKGDLGKGMGCRLTTLWPWCEASLKRAETRRFEARGSRAKAPLLRSKDRLRESKTSLFSDAGRSVRGATVLGPLVLIPIQPSQSGQALSWFQEPRLCSLWSSRFLASQKYVPHKMCLPSRLNHELFQKCKGNCGYFGS